MTSKKSLSERDICTKIITPAIEKAGIDITTIKELLGHKTLTMTLRYAHLAPAHKVKAVEILEGAMNGKPTIQKLYSAKEKGLAYVS